MKDSNVLPGDYVVEKEEVFGAVENFEEELVKKKKEQEERARVEEEEKNKKPIPAPIEEDSDEMVESILKKYSEENPNSENKQEE